MAKREFTAEPTTAPRLPTQEGKQRTHAGTLYEYAGCYKNEAGSKRLNGHAYNKSVEGCADAAWAGAQAFFGMEYPEDAVTAGGPAGHAQCLVMGNLPTQERVADAECDAEGQGTHGNRLGSEYRVAVYARPVYRPVECAGINVTGSAHQPSINGCYLNRDKAISGFPSYINGNGKVLHYQPSGGGGWWFADESDGRSNVPVGYRAYAPGSGPEGPAPRSAHYTWMTWMTTWVPDKPLAFNTGSRICRNGSVFSSTTENSSMCTGCAGINATGSLNQPSINGCYLTRDTAINGFPSYGNGNDTVLYWEPTNSGQWVIGVNVGSSRLASTPGTGAAGPTANLTAASTRTWTSWKGAWVSERLALRTANDTSVQLHDPPSTLPHRLGIPGTLITQYIKRVEVIDFRLFRATELAFAIRPKDGVARQGRRGGFIVALPFFKWHQKS